MFTIIPRDSPVGTRVFQLRDVVDAKQRASKPLDFRLVNFEARKRFAVDRSNGYLVLRKSLVEAQQRILKVDVAYSAAGEKLLTHLAHLTVFVDNRSNFGMTQRRSRRQATSQPPRFTNRRITSTVSEAASVGTLVRTMAANYGGSGNLKYSMSPSQNLDSKNYFQINPISGAVTTLKVLDRETMATHYFRVKAEVRGKPNMYGQCELVIKVDDVNDNFPIFEHQSYTKTVPEELGIGDPVIQVRAVDKDDGTNADIRYSFETPTAAFLIDQKNGLVTVQRELDRETVPEYSLKVRAEDRGTPPKSATVNLRIVVRDVNDNAPIFSKSNYPTKIREDARPGSLVVTVTATDKDQGTNSDILYDIVGGNDDGLFSINRINGEIKVANNLDYERMPLYNLLIGAQDKGKPPQLSQATVEIELINVNDNAPQFINPHFQTSVQESVDANTVIFKVVAMDSDGNGKDINSQIVYSITTSGMPFSVDPNTGDIKTTRKLDREKNAKFTFSLKAADKGKPSKEGFCQMTVTLIDVNDNPPTFDKAVYEASIPEESHWGARVVAVSANDPDGGPSNVFYSFGNSGVSCFHINGQGVITLSCRLNYNHIKQYSFTVKASDGLLDSTAVVIVNVTDSNTYAPIFKKRSYTASVLEDVKRGALVVEVLATDGDHGLNAKISYSFEGDVSDFTIDSDSGQIRTSGSLDRESHPTYSMAVSARDHGVPPKTAKAVVYITVDDVNDNAPVFTKVEYSAIIRENIPPPKTVLTVTATDQDKGSNKAVQYKLSSKGDYVSFWTCRIVSCSNVVYFTKGTSWFTLIN